MHTHIHQSKKKCGSNLSRIMRRFSSLKMWIHGCNNLMNVMIPIVFFFVTLIIILITYSSLKEFSSGNWPLLIFSSSVVVSCVLGTASSVTFCSQVTKSSLGIIDRVKRLTYMFPKSNYLKCLVNSLKPIVFRIGVFFPINDFLTLNTIAVVSTYVMTLLVSFR